MQASFLLPPPPITSYASSSSLRALKTLADSRGILSFTTVMLMLHLDLYDVDLTDRSWIRMSCYMDALAFFITYMGDIVTDPFLDVTPFLTTARLCWAVSVSLLLAYFVTETLKAVRSRRKWIARASGGLSFVAMVGFVLAGDDGGWTSFIRIALISFWLFVELVCLVVLCWRWGIPCLRRRYSSNSTNNNNINNNCYLDGGHADDADRDSAVPQKTQSPAANTSKQLVGILAILAAANVWALVFLLTGRAPNVVYARGLLIEYVQMQLVLRSERDDHDQQNNQEMPPLLDDIGRERTWQQRL
ncbi:hypothetical protein BCR33DRAFT_854005 [Rhizoclosmatium globosum]|uniref:Transmembrane protein n=1 Tax=Rhizoclosmatium globosum TaxID=329046 RepID=A0A1Y2BU99_9FUNG|nr:hypothetical protein BCR33DRAFT_854005 [Rhizoclosmatium globosum]|eukprot:ORY38329.1 hypothetical protein BCR33DRAFT_854005 [Rhizoclosmatium globosum]